MLTVAATGRSEAAPLSAGEGEVVCMGATAIHIAAGDALLAIAKAGAGLPFGVEVPYTTDWMSLPLAVGDRAMWTEDRIVVGTSLTVTGLASCRAYAHRIEAQEEIGITIETLETLCTWAPAEDVPPPAEAILRGTAQGIVDRAAPARLADALIGRGRGSTPAGDDFLSGLYGALLLGGASWKETRESLAAEIRLRLSRTTRLSRAYLAALLDGCWHAGVADFLRAVQRASPLLERRTKTLLSYGHSSGSDFLRGFLAGARWITGRGERASGSSCSAPRSGRRTAFARVREEDNPSGNL